jgi:sulfate/thiosulfate transport system permease protein
VDQKLLQWCMRNTAFTYLCLVVLLPIVFLYGKGFSSGWYGFWSVIRDPFCWQAIVLTFRLAGIATVINAIVGTFLAWVLVRYRFPGRRVLNSLVELPFALPTAIGGLMLLLLLGPHSWIGILLKKVGVELVFHQPAIVIAMVFVTFPFVIRTVQPLLEKLDPAEEEAAYMLGARPIKTFQKVLFPAIRTGIVSGAMLSFSRALAEFGAVVMVAGNIPGKTIVAPVYMYSLIENDNFPGAAAVSVLLLTISFIMLWIVDRVVKRSEFR